MAATVNYYPAAGGAGTVDTDTTLTGDGSSGDPLGVNPVAARAPDWFGYCKTLFQQYTGLSPIAWSSIYENDFATTSNGVGATNAGDGFQASGAGAVAVYTNLVGGVVKATGSSGAGYCDWTSNTSAAGWQTIGNLRTKRWAVAYRISIGTTPAAASRITAGVFSSTNVISGLGYSGAQANWQYCRGAAPTNIADTGQPITVSAGGTTGYLTIIMGNFDLTNVSYIIDAVTSVTLVTAEAVSNLANGGAQAYIWNEGTGASDVYHIDKALVMTEL
jgi:hypothetical protein